MGPNATAPSGAACADVAIVILNWNGAGFLARFLPGVLAHADGARVIVADNASTDCSIELLARDFPTVELLLLERNFGFCEGYNQALAQVDSPFFVLLNSDVEVTLGWLRPARPNRSPPAHRRRAAQSPRPRRPHALRARRRRWRLPRPPGLPLLPRPSLRHPRKGPWPVRRPAPRGLGQRGLRVDTPQRLAGTERLRTGFFAHMEEIDFCWRLQNAGHEVWYHGGSAVHHVGGGTLPKTNPRKTYLNFRNGLALLYKNAAPGELLGPMLQRLVLDGVAGLRFLLAGEFGNFRAILRAHFSFYGKFGYWRQQRAAARPHLRVRDRAGVYNGSLVWAYFVKGERKFSNLRLR